MSGFIAVHVGAGYHAEQKRPLYKKLCKKACKEAVQLLNKNVSSVEAITEAVSILEDSPLTNAGIGSNLTLTGCIECDAGIMDGSNLTFGSVGAVSNIKNPIKVALKILDEQNKGLLSCGRIPPCTLVGRGATMWALDNGFSLFHGLKTKMSEKMFLKNASKLYNCDTLVNHNTEKVEMPSCYGEKSHDDSTLLDTVGAVCIDLNGNLSSAVSSGGLLLKYSGRIGQAAVYGSGCWAENSTLSEKPSIALSATGVGEYLIKTMFAKECFNMLQENSNSTSPLADALKNKFVDSPFIRNCSPKLAGVLSLKNYSVDQYCELSWAHTSETMILGYMSTLYNKPYSVVSVNQKVLLLEKAYFVVKNVLNYKFHKIKIFERMNKKVC